MQTPLSILKSLKVSFLSPISHQPHSSNPKKPWFNSQGFLLQPEKIEGKIAVREAVLTRRGGLHSQSHCDALFSYLRGLSI
jgi:hypothetical protein